MGVTTLKKDNISSNLFLNIENTKIDCLLRILENYNNWKFNSILFQN
jgi:hypothetical protein